MMPSPKVASDTEAVLRRLRADVEAFRSEEVREQLIDSPQEPVRRTIPALEAQLIHFRTSLAKANDRIGELEKALTDSESNLVEERTRAGKLETSLSAAEHERDSLTARVAELESDHLTAAKAASENAVLLSVSSKTGMARSAQLEADLSEARAALDEAVGERDAAKAELEAETREFEHHREVVEDEKVALQNLMDTLQKENARLCAKHEEEITEAGKQLVEAASSTRKVMAEVAELRAECATRAEEARSARADFVAKAAEARAAMKDVRRKELELYELKALRSSMAKVQSEMDRARIAEEVVEALREEKGMICGLIGALAPSGLPEDGLNLIKQAAFKKSILKLSEVEPRSSASIEAMSAKLAGYAEDMERAREEAARVTKERDFALNESAQSKKYLASAKKELEATQAHVKDPSTQQLMETTRARIAEYESTIEEMKKALEERDKTELKAMRRQSVNADLYRDLCIMLHAQLRQASSNRKRGRSVNDGRVKNGRVSKR